MIYFSNEHRSEQEEIMDDVGFQGAEMRSLLRDLKIVNKFLGGNAISLNGIENLLQNQDKEKTFTILDIGCGDGELLRKCADFAKQKNYNFKLIGLDYNQNILDFAKKQSIGYHTINFYKVDVFLEEKLIPKCDIALCTLVLHHFSNTKIESLLKALVSKSDIGLVINDLERSKYAFNLFKVFSGVFLKTNTAKYDGLVSIARGFKKSELAQFSANIANQKSTIQWRWAYRYQWILKKEL